MFYLEGGFWSFGEDFNVVFIVFLDFRVFEIFVEVCMSYGKVINGCSNLDFFEVV